MNRKVTKSNAGDWNFRERSWTSSEMYVRTSLALSLSLSMENCEINFLGRNINEGEDWSNYSMLFSLLLLLLLSDLWRQFRIELVITHSLIASFAQNSRCVETECSRTEMQRKRKWQKSKTLQQNSSHSCVDCVNAVDRRRRNESYCCGAVATENETNTTQHNDCHCFVAKGCAT